MVVDPGRLCSTRVRRTRPALWRPPRRHHYPQGVYGPAKCCAKCDTGPRGSSFTTCSSLVVRCIAQGFARVVLVAEGRPSSEPHFAADPPPPPPQRPPPVPVQNGGGRPGDCTGGNGGTESCDQLKCPHSGPPLAWSQWSAQTWLHSVAADALGPNTVTELPLWNPQSAGLRGSDWGILPVVPIPFG